MDAASWDQRYQERELLWSAGPNAFVAAEAASLPPGRALDVACGEGRNAVWLAGLGWQATGIDFSPVALDRGRSLAAERSVEVEWREEDVASADLGDGDYDLVVVAYLHLPWGELRGVLARSARAVAPGGTLIAVGHDLANLAIGHGGPPNPEVLWTVDRIGEAITPTLVMERGALVTRTVDTDDGPRVALDTLVRAHRSA